MKKLLIILFFTSFILLTFSTISIAEKYTLTDDLSISEISEGVFLIDHRFPWSANSLIVKFRKNFVWIDTPYTDDATEMVYNWIRKKFGNIELIEINTGFHNDNLGGNGFLLKKGIKVFGSDLTVKLLREREKTTRELILKWLKKPRMKKYHRAYISAVYEPPANVFKIGEGLSLDFEGEKVEVFYPGPSHSPDNLVVYFTSKKLLFGGCMVKSQRSKKLGFTGDAVLAKWPEALRRVKEKFPSALVVIPGHGEKGSIKLIDHTLSLLGTPSGTETKNVK